MNYGNRCWLSIILKIENPYKEGNMCFQCQINARESQINRLEEEVRDGEDERESI